VPVIALRMAHGPFRGTTMNLTTRILVLTLLISTASPTLAEDKIIPEPVPLGVPYVYQISNQYWYQPFTFYPTAWYSYYSPYPFGSLYPVYGLYSWDYGVYYPVAYGWYPYSIVNYPSVYGYPLPYGRVWLWYGW
jgi:hypothetical protein